MLLRIPRLPEFTQRAAEEIDRRWRDLAHDLPREDYIPCIGWQTRPGERAFSRPILSLRERKRVPIRLQIDGHGMRLAYDLPDHVLKVVRIDVLDFDGKEFVFVRPSVAAARARQPKRRHPNADQKRGLRVSTLLTFMHKYGRKAPKRGEPNDRHYSRDVEQRVRRMKPADLDRLLHDDED